LQNPHPLLFFRARISLSIPLDITLTPPLYTTSSRLIMLICDYIQKVRSIAMTTHSYSRIILRILKDQGHTHHMFIQYKSASLLKSSSFKIEVVGGPWPGPSIKNQDSVPHKKNPTIDLIFMPTDINTTPIIESNLLACKLSRSHAMSMLRRRGQGVAALWSEG
jgi:hypothetical protein